MIRDYSVYELNEKEKIIFYLLGYNGIAFVIYLFYHSPFLSLLGGIIIIKLRPYYEKIRVSERMKKLDIQFKDLLYSLSASVASGRHMSESILEAYDNLSVMYSDDELIMIELAYMRKAITENNESDAVLLADFAERSRNEDINNFVQVYLTCRSLGGNMERIISRTSDILTDKMNIKREIKAITAQKKLEGRLIALMPLAMLLILNILSPSYIALLYAGISGRLIMTGCLLASACGVLLMEKISTVEI
ncbi:MAG: type II secretion system F family protein [Eubacteriales bacterium]|nr:type II secretion system F family protein [Eubacteriales bacterium]